MAASPVASSTSELSNRSRIIERIERDAGVPHLAAILSDRLAPTDLQSLLLEVYAQRAKRRDPKVLLEDHVSNRFTQPSATNPTRLLEWDRVAFSKLPNRFGLSNSHPFVHWEQLPYSLRLVRTGLFRRSEIRRLSPTRLTCSRLNVRFDAASKETSLRVMQLQSTSQPASVF